MQNVAPSHILNLFKDKDITIVAGGQCDKGAEIDSSEVVVRLNDIHNIYPIQDKYIKSHGKKCDILFREHHELFVIMGKVGDLEYANKIADIGIKDVILWDGIGKSDDIATRLTVASNGRFRVHILSNDYYPYRFLHYFLRPPKIPTTGLMAVTLIAMCSPMSISMYGFTFYSRFLYNNIYYNGTRRMVKNKEESPRHLHNLEVEIFRKYIYWMANIYIDIPLLNIIKERMAMDAHRIIDYSIGTDLNYT